MSSEIKGPGATDLQAVDFGKARRADRAGDSGHTDARAAGSGGEKPPGDQVRLTDTAATLRRIESSLATEPPVDAARVAAVRGAVENGTYAPDPAKVSERLVEFERLLAPGDGKA